MKTGTAGWTATTARTTWVTGAEASVPSGSSTSTAAGLDRSITPVTTAGNVDDSTRARTPCDCRAVASTSAARSAASAAGVVSTVGPSGPGADAADLRAHVLATALQ